MEISNNFFPVNVTSCSCIRLACMWQKYKFADVLCCCIVSSVVWLSGASHWQCSFKGFYGVHVPDIHNLLLLKIVFLIHVPDTKNVSSESSMMCSACY